MKEKIKKIRKELVKSYDKLGNDLNEIDKQLIGIINEVELK